MTANHYDTIIIGAVHNGLVAAAYLAQKGKKVLVLERRFIMDGSAVTESIGEGFILDCVCKGGTHRSDIIKDLKLSLPSSASASPVVPVSAKPAIITLLGTSHARIEKYADHLVTDSVPIKATESIKRFSE